MRVIQKALTFDDVLLVPAHSTVLPREVSLSGIIVADAAIQYRSEAFHGEVLVVEMSANDFSKYGFDLVWRISDRATGREVARGKHGMMCLDYSIRKPALVPEAFVARAGG